VQLSGAGSSDPEQAANTLSYAWDLDNDGSFETSGINPTFSAAGLDGPSSRTVKLRVTDSGFLSDIDEATINITNVPPDIQNVVITPQLDENGVATLSGNIVDPGTPDTFSLVVNWGEGNPVTYTYPAGTTSFSETHQYRDDNPTATPQDGYNVTLSLSDDDGGTDSAAVATLVKNVAPLITAFTSDAVECGERGEGDAVHVTGTFTDPGSLDTHTATISWGDGETTTATLVAGAIAGEHLYSSGGIFRIVITLTDDDTGQTTAQTIALVTGVGILNGQLQVVGTKSADNVTVGQDNNGSFKVHASFIDDSPRSLPAAGVTSIAMILCDGDDHATISSQIDLPAYITAEEGDDELNGGGGPNILLGGDGDDRINGGKGHDILVGGDGADRIVANGGDDILIAGTLGGSADPIHQLDALLALLIEWDLERDRTRLRLKMLVGGDDGEDKLTGSSGTDWHFFDFDEDQATGLKDEPAEDVG
jgi:Ca2+-binding RTX toxin-like protein